MTNNKKNIKRGDGSAVSASNIIAILFDEKSIREKARTRLTTFSGNNDNKFLDKLTGFTADERKHHTPADRKEKKKRLFKKSESQLIFINNLMNIYWFFGSADAAIEIVMNKISHTEIKEKVDSRISELKFFAAMYDHHAKHGIYIRGKRQSKGLNTRFLFFQAFNVESVRQQ